jgi:hypothetical protein
VSNGYNVTMGETLVAMQSALLAQTSMPYLTGASACRIVSSKMFYDPWFDYTVYLEPLGSPETTVAEDGGTGIAKYAVHTVGIHAVMKVEDPFDEAAIVGRIGSRVGITEFVADLCEFLENNMLGLTGLLEDGVPPRVEFGSGAYEVVEADDDIWLLCASGLYQAQTRAYYRTGTFS